MSAMLALQEEVQELRVALQDIKTEINTQVSFLAHDLIARTTDSLGSLSSRQVELGNILSQLDSGLNSRLNSLDTAVFEAGNRLAHLDTSLHTRVNQMEFVQLPSLLEQIHEAATMQLELGGDMQPQHDSSLTVPHTAPVSLEKLFDLARRDFPTVFDDWHTRLEEMRTAFAETKTGNAANAADIYSRLFRIFVNRHARGPLLDIGSGPFGRPFYLLDYPSNLIAGLEPLGQQEGAEIDVVEGISEYLPWASATFSTVVSATSLDHCLSLERSLAEIERVLKRDGRFLLWLGSIPGSPRYDPLATDFAPADRFHLFHFDVAWFEPMLAERFEIHARIKLDRAAYSHFFYCLAPRERAPERGLKPRV